MQNNMYYSDTTGLYHWELTGPAESADSAHKVYVIKWLSIEARF